MKILVVAATLPEVEPLILHFKLASSNFMQHQKFDLLITGAGMTATAFSLGRHLDSRYSWVLNLGIAGSFDPKIAIGTLITIVEDQLAEFGAQDHDDFISADVLGLGPVTFSGLPIKTLPSATAITVNKVHGSETQIAETIERLHPHAESMEGAAVFFCCATLNIPCAQVRSISNFVTPRNKDSWNIPLAIKTLNEWAINFLEQKTFNL